MMFTGFYYTRSPPAKENFPELHMLRQTNARVVAIDHYKIKLSLGNT